MPKALRIITSIAEEQHHGHPQQEPYAVAGEQPRSGQADERRGDVAGQQREGHARPGRPPRGEGEARGVRVQPDAMQPASGQQRDQGVPALVRDGDGVARDPPRQAGQHHHERDGGVTSQERGGSGCATEEPIPASVRPSTEVTAGEPSGTPYGQVYRRVRPGKPE